VTFGIVAIFVHTPRDPRYAAMSWVQLIKQLDLPGIVTIIPAVICLLLALQWGGSTFLWNNVRIIVLLILFGLLTITFVAVQIYTPKTHTIPSSLFRSRSIGFTTWYTGCTFSLLVVMIYYLPIWFQGVQRVTAFQSGIRTMPLIIGFIVFALISGVLTSVLGYYTPFMIASSILTPIGVGLLSTLRPSSPSSQWIGYQALFGSGVGIGIQQPLLVIQTVLPEPDVPVGTALITLTQSLFGAVFVSVAQNVFQNQLASNIHAVLPDFDTSQIQRSGATTLIQGGQESDRAALTGAYSTSVTQTFYIAVALGALSLFGSLGTEWRSVKEKHLEVEDTNLADHSAEKNEAGVTSTS
jgi:hypothetical protein